MVVHFQVRYNVQRLLSKILIPQNINFSYFIIIYFSKVIKLIKNYCILLCKAFFKTYLLS